MKLNFKHKLLGTALLSISLVSCGASNGSSKEYGKNSSLINGEEMAVIIFECPSELIRVADCMINFRSQILDKMETSTLSNEALMNSFLHSVERYLKNYPETNQALLSIIRDIKLLLQETKVTPDLIKKLADDLVSASGSSNSGSQNGSTGGTGGGGGGYAGSFEGATGGSMCLVTVYYDDGSEETQIVHVSGECPSGGMGAPNFI